MYSSASSTYDAAQYYHQRRDFAQPGVSPAASCKPGASSAAPASNSSTSTAASIMRFDFFERRLSGLFRKYIKLVSHYPRVFMLLPVLLSLVLLFGFVKNPPLIRDELSLYTPTNAPARHEAATLRQYFDIDDTDPYYYIRRPSSFSCPAAGVTIVSTKVTRNEVERQGHIIITGHAGDIDVLTETVMFDVSLLWDKISKIKIVDGGRSYTYEELCVQYTIQRPPNITSRQCIANQLLLQWDQLRRADNGTHLSASELLNKLRYPVTTDGVFIGHLLGGVAISHDKYVSGARAIVLPYMLQHSNSHLDSLAARWEAALTKALQSYKSFRIRLAAPLKSVAWWTSETLGAESARDRDALLRLLLPLFVVLTSFTVACCFVADWVRSRPWLGLGGVVSAGMAIVSSIGLLLLLDYNFTSVAYTMPFIMFSIGVDNVFILLSAWRKTPYNLTLSKRMAMSFSEAGVSITVTSLTDALSFGVGCFSTFPSVKVFCVYSTVAIAFVYFYQLTFFAGVMVLTGRREMDNKHCLTFKPMADTSAVPEPAANKWPTHGRAYHTHHALHSNHSLARFFRTTYADLLLNPVVRVLVITVFCVYLTLAAWGCTHLQLGLRPTDLLPADSYGQRALLLHDKYFSDYGSFVHVMLTNLSHLNYETEIWRDLEMEASLFEHTEFTGYADSWIRLFMAFVHTAGYELEPGNFIYILKNIFLVSPAYAKFARDIVFDGSGLKLEAVRFPVQLRFVGVANQSRAMHMLRRLAGSSQLQVQVYSDFFLFAEQYDAVLPGTLLNIAIAGGAVICVSLLFIPKPDAALWVSMTIASINVGILGYMSLWGVRLDFVSMVTIVMSIGFCVDFSAHIAYTFSKEHGAHVSDRLREALYSVGTPILQSAASTIIGISFLWLIDSYVYRSFLKTVLLVVVLGAAHGLVILPVLLTMLSCQHSPPARRSSEYAGSSTCESPVPPPPLPLPPTVRPVYVLPPPVAANSYVYAAAPPPAPLHHSAAANAAVADEMPYVFPTAVVFDR